MDVEKLKQEFSRGFITKGAPVPGDDSAYNAGMSAKTHGYENYDYNLELYIKGKSDDKKVIY